MLHFIKTMLGEPESEPVFPDWAQEKVDARICLVCGEKIGESDVVSRGCHESHMKRVRRAINDGEYTEFQQEADEAVEKLRKRAGGETLNDVLDRGM